MRGQAGCRSATDVRLTRALVPMALPVTAITHEDDNRVSSGHDPFASLPACMHHHRRYIRMNAPQLYQVMPPLSPAEYAALKADIAERGVQVPVEYDEEGHILDGFHRVQICEELGIDYPKIVRPGLTDEPKRAHAWALNLTRRHLSKAQKRVIASRLRQEGWTQERIAQVLGLSQATISGWLHELINSDELPQPAAVVGKDGKRYPTKKVAQPSMQQTGEIEAERGVEAASAAPAPAATRVDPDRDPDPQPPVEPTDPRQAKPEGPGREVSDDPGGRVRERIDALYEVLTRQQSPDGLRAITQQWTGTMQKRYRGRCGTLIRALRDLRATLNAPQLVAAAFAGSQTTSAQTVKEVAGGERKGSAAGELSKDLHISDEMAQPVAPSTVTATVTGEHELIEGNHTEEWPQAEMADASVMPYVFSVTAQTGHAWEEEL